MLYPTSSTRSAALITNPSSGAGSESQSQTRYRRFVGALPRISLCVNNGLEISAVDVTFKIEDSSTKLHLKNVDFLLIPLFRQQLRYE